MKFFSMTLSLVLLIAVGLTACGAGETTDSAPAVPATPTPVSLLTNPEQATQEAVTLTPVAATVASPVEVTPTLTPTLEVAATDTPLPTPPPSPEPSPTSTVIPTLTSTPLPTTPPEPVVQLPESSSDRINIRSGPGTTYPVVGQLAPGQTASVVGRNADNSWWQIEGTDVGAAESLGWVFGELVNFSGDNNAIALVEAPPPPPSPTPQPVAAPPAEAGGEAANDEGDSAAPEDLASQLECGKDFCVTYQAMVPIGENGGCIGNHSIYITVLQGPPPGQPMDGVVIGDTYNNVEVASGSNGPGRTEITLWMNSMTLIAKRHQDGTPYTSEESFNFTSHDELIPAEVLAANGYCEGSVEKCRVAHQNNQVCRGHYSWRVTFHKFN